MKKYLLAALFFNFVHLAQAQLNNNYLYNRIRPADSLTHEIHLNFYNFNYVRNYEYSNDFHDGYTLYGTQIEPQVTYYAHPNLAITAGAYLRKDFGNERGLYDAKPLFNVKYSKKDLTLVFGSLEGNIQHNYIDPLYNFERKITTPVEYGTQLLIDKEKFSLDAWIAWEKMIYRSDAAKERIAGGFTSDITLVKSNGWKLSIPAQALIYHTGGQIDVLNEIPLSTLLNAASGFTLSKNIGYHIKQVYTNNYIAAYKDNSPTKTRAYRGGFGLWLNAGADTRWGNLAASYWQGNQFITIKGMPLYQSVSENLNNFGFTADKRRILMLRYQYQRELLPNLFLDVRFEPHFDLDNAEKNLQFNQSFFLTYRENFRLFKLKK
ncbi:MAG: hypothetical protein REI64_08385 [Pedobacter sp.]|uniref:hypothetical protein n=1 Tax=Pedobacter sp. TaxID=1411316 RepID=UPI002808BE1E|nr:hypothetical protein [Pedobacter sp.]MDQ8004800.1 hypothetical protein [Pedobacter sp.]